MDHVGRLGHSHGSCGEVRALLRVVLDLWHRARHCVLSVIVSVWLVNGVCSSQNDSTLTTTLRSWCCGWLTGENQSSGWHGESKHCRLSTVVFLPVPGGLCELSFPCVRCGVSVPTLHGGHRERRTDVRGPRELFTQVRFERVCEKTAGSVYCLGALLGTTPTQRTSSVSDSSKDDEESGRPRAGSQVP